MSSSDIAYNALVRRLERPTDKSFELLRFPQKPGAPAPLLAPVVSHPVDNLLSMLYLKARVPQMIVLMRSLSFLPASFLIGTGLIVCKHFYSAIMFGDDIGLQMTVNSSEQLRRIIQRGFRPSKLIVSSLFDAGVSALYYRESLKTLDIRCCVEGESSMDGVDIVWDAIRSSRCLRSLITSVVPPISNILRFFQSVKIHSLNSEESESIPSLIEYASERMTELRLCGIAWKLDRLSKVFDLIRLHKGLKILD